MPQIAMPDPVQKHDPYTDLNEGQRKAALGVSQWLVSKSREYMISGAGGTGKTFLLDKIMGTVLPEARLIAKMMGRELKITETVFTATTNKAAEVLGNAIGREAKTIHSHISVKPITDYRTGLTTLKPNNRNFQVLSNQLIVIDECSMIDTELLSWIRKATDDSCKILYLGDHCQMAPVGETVSPVFHNARRISHLTQPMRNAEQPALIDLCAQVRQIVETGRFTPLPHVPGVVDHLSPEDGQALVDRTFAGENAEARILAYTNAKVNDFNHYLRQLRGRPEAFTSGERVINNRVLQLASDTLLRVEQEVVIGDVTPAFQEIHVDQEDNSKVLTVYPAQVIVKGQTFNVNIPVDRERHQELIRYYGRRKNWSVHFWLKDGFPDFRPRDACTVYKAQGSTYDTVFLDLSDIGACRDREQLARMLYVGVSRARTRVVCFGALPEHLFNAV